MASMMYKTERRVNIKFTLNDISEEACEKIVEFIQNIVDEENKEIPSISILDEINVWHTEEKAKSMPIISSMHESHENKKNNKKKKDERIEEILDLYMDYMARPKNYDLVKMTTHEFVEKNPMYEGCSPVAIGRKLSKMAKEYSSVIPGPEEVVGKTSGGSPSKCMSFSVPVRKVTYGSLIKKCRELNDLSIRDFSDLIGYDVGLIKSWEDDMNTPSNEAISNIEHVCGDHVFDALKAQ